jgi:hypothetical protein
MIWTDVRAAQVLHLVVPERPPAVHVAVIGDHEGAIGATLL